MTCRSPLGATCMGEGSSQFCVWAPSKRSVEVHILSPQDRIETLHREEHGYFQALLGGVEPGCRYFFRLDGNMERPDPASRDQPEGVHGPSCVANPFFSWEDEHWFGIPLKDYIIYEIHVGTFTPEGTFDAVIPHLDELKDLGVSAIELMPVAQFPGTRNWGYDGVYPFAVQVSYGGSGGFKRLVNACHQRGLAVVQDVVYNHLGPEGNYLRDFGPYFTDRYRGPWGSCINFDGPHSDQVRRFFIENALYWVGDCHVDALRLDAVHGILDFSAKTFLQELAEAVHEEGERANRRVYLIPESALNDPKLIRSPRLGGYGLDAQWNDDFHHALHTLLTGEKAGYYQDFGLPEHMAKAFCEGYVYSGEYSSYRKRRHGSSSKDIPAHRFVVFAQNHDQVGNRMLGERLSRLVSLEGLKLAAACVILSPFIPLLFMGEEYGETAPFPYFISHSDPNLVEAVRQGRKEEFAAFGWKEAPPDPQEEATFLQAKLDRTLRGKGDHRVLYLFFKELIRHRKDIPPLARLSKDHMSVSIFAKGRALLIRRWSEPEEAALVFHFGKEPQDIDLPLPRGAWIKGMDSAEAAWHGSGSAVPGNVASEGWVHLTLAPHGFLLFLKEKET
ncbi:MAG: malto-oligosyltrehalose trehalohydrolase [Deltaproteobacteria bacterium]